MKKLPDCRPPQDNEVWLQEVADIKPLPEVDEPPSAPLVIEAITPSTNHKGLYNHNSFNRLNIGDTANIDRRLAEKFTKGKLKIEARLDLHGLSEKDAFTAVRDFIAYGYRLQRRCLLIITGKGEKRDPWWESHGIIKQSFPNWINHPDIRPYILSVAQALPEDGGSGAFYCLLKRQK